MAKKKKIKKRLFKNIIFFVIFICVIFLIVNKLFRKNGDDYIKDDEKYTLDFNIVDKIEADSDSIEEIFEDGMSISDFKNILLQKENYIEKNGKYNLINYDFDRKLHYSEIENIIYNMNNSDIVNVEVIGKSLDNRNIYGIEIGNGKDVLYIDANVHAAEVASTLLLTRFLSEIINDYESGDKNIVSALNDVKIAIIPCMNPDGYEIYNFGVESLNNKDLWVYQNKDKINFSLIKSNANGVDLNRNFPTQNAGMYFKGNKLINNVSLEKTTSTSKYFNGYSVGSESETKAAMYFMLKHFRNTYAYINMHSQGRVIYAGKPNLSNEFNELTSKFAKKISSINKYTVHGLSSEEVGEGNDGSVTDFMAELANGFDFSSKSGRLYTDKHINNSCTLEYRYPVITLETMNLWTSDPDFFKNEYYYHGIRDMFYKLLDKNYIID